MPHTRDAFAPRLTGATQNLRCLAAKSLRLLSRGRSMISPDAYFKRTSARATMQFVLFAFRDMRACSVANAERGALKYSATYGHVRYSATYDHYDLRSLRNCQGLPIAAPGRVERSVISIKAGFMSLPLMILNDEHQLCQLHGRYLILCASS
jgi:hypothetical protein